MKSIKQIWKSCQSFLQSQKLFGTTLENLLLKLLYGLATLAVIVWMLPSERPFEYSNLTIGSIAPEEIIAPFKFPIEKKPEVLQQERDQAWANVPAVFEKDGDLGVRQELTLRNFFDELQRFFFNHTLLVDNGNGEMVLDSSAAPVDSFLKSFNLKYSARLNIASLVELYSIYRQNELVRFQNSIKTPLKNVYQQGILDRTRQEISEQQLSVVENDIEEVIPVSDVLDINDARLALYEELTQRYEGDSKRLIVAEDLLAIFLRPNLHYLDQVTSERKQKAINEVPLTRGYVEQDERIIDSNEKVTQDIYQKLSSLSEAHKERSRLQGQYEQVKFYLGKHLFAITLLLITILYIIFYRKDVFSDNRMLGMVTLIYLLQLGTAAVVIYGLNLPHYSIPIVLAPMLLAMLLDISIAFICTVSLSLLLGSILGNDYVFTFMGLIVGSMAIFSVQNIRNRGHMFRSILLVIFAYLVVKLLFGLLHFESMQQIFWEFTLYLLPNAILTPAVVFILLLGIFEKLFDVTTDITLLELSDLNHPLLKRLSVEAPGSFHHSIVVANLAEAAALSIRANALLTRVGCYFHDIGKMLKPEYFVENQMGGINKHDNLSPHMSCLILANHVKEGVKLAEKHKLPKAVKMFISEHHGTSLMAFFYHKFVESSDGKDVNESDFRYPGPKPQSKETAITMLADTVEAASRTLKDPTPARIRNLIDTLVEKKIEEDQLDHCDLTFEEINHIKEAFIPIITGIHHLRIEYPAEPDADKKAAKEKSGGTTREKTSREKADTDQAVSKNPNGAAPEKQPPAPEVLENSDDADPNRHNSP